MRNNACREDVRCVLLRGRPLFATALPVYNVEATNHNTNTVRVENST
jgi:hypothetical protein